MADRSILQRMHSDHDSSNFVAGSAGDSSWQSQISGLADGTDLDKAEFKDHFGREYYKKLKLLGVSHSHDLDSGGRPTNLSQIYTL
jgi:hypothetical protein